MDTIMYRSEDSYGSGKRDILDVMTYEIYGLNNTDILYYVREHYLDDKLKHTITELMYSIEEGLDEFTEEEVYDVCKRIVDIINKKTNHNLKYVLWLADKSVVQDMYADDLMNIDAYYTSDIILSDLGSDGILFAYDDYPEPIQ